MLKKFAEKARESGDDDGLTLVFRSSKGLTVSAEDKVRAGDCSGELYKEQRVIKIEATGIKMHSVRVQFLTKQSRNLQYTYQITSATLLLACFTEKFTECKDVKEERATRWGFTVDGYQLREEDTFDSLVQAGVLELEEMPEGGFLFDAKVLERKK